MTHYRHPRFGGAACSFYTLRPRGPVTSRRRRVECRNCRRTVAFGRVAFAQRQRKARAKARAH